MWLRVDANDLEILMSGGHKIFFDAFEMMKQLIDVSEEENKKKKLETQRSSFLKIFHNIKCPCIRQQPEVVIETVVVQKEEQNQQQLPNNEIINHSLNLNNSMNNMFKLKDNHQ